MGISPLSGNFNTASKVENDFFDRHQHSMADEAYGGFVSSLSEADRNKIFVDGNPPETFAEFSQSISGTRQLVFDLEKAYEICRMERAQLQAFCEDNGLIEAADPTATLKAAIASNKADYLKSLQNVEKLRKGLLASDRQSHELHRTAPIVGVMASFIGLATCELFDDAWLSWKPNYKPHQKFVNAFVSKYSLQDDQIGAITTYVELALNAGRHYEGKHAKAARFTVNGIKHWIGNVNPETPRLHGVVSPLSDKLSISELFGVRLISGRWGKNRPVIDYDGDRFMESAAANARVLINEERIYVLDETCSDWDLFRNKALDAGYNNVNQHCFDSVMDGKPVELKAYMLFADVMKVDLDALLGNHSS